MSITFMNHVTNSNSCLGDLQVDKDRLASMLGCKYSIETCKYYNCYLHYLNSERKGADQIAKMCMLICTFVAHIWYKQVLHKVACNFDVEINLFVLNHKTDYTISEFVFVVFELLKHSYG